MQPELENWLMIKDEGHCFAIPIEKVKKVLLNVGFESGLHMETNVPGIASVWLALVSSSSRRQPIFF